ncbi:OmpA family protein [Planctomycetales bacterium ZRK34]|nr:OmpA family protein [Planctomycetales bacterium ZRK34]
MMTTRWISGRSTALVALAMMSLLAGGCQDKLKAERDALYAQNQELQSELDASRTALEQCNADRSRLESQVADLQGQMATPAKAEANSPFGGIGGIEVHGAPGQIAVRVPGDVLFSPGKVDLKSTAKSTLQQIAGVIKSQYPDKVVRVEGYTDTDPIKKSKWKDNLELSAMRAMAVQRYLQSQGIANAKMYAAGKHTMDTQSTKAKSRRVEIVVLTASQ